MKNQSYGYLERAHRVICEVAKDLVGAWRVQAIEAARDIETFVKHGRQPDLLNKLHATRHAHLPDTVGQE